MPVKHPHLRSTDEIEADQAFARSQKYDLRGDCSYIDEHIDSHEFVNELTGRWVCGICHPRNARESDRNG